MQFDIEQMIEDHETLEAILQAARNGPCQGCNASQTDRAMIYRGEPYCSDNCRKRLGLARK